MSHPLKSPTDLALVAAGTIGAIALTTAPLMPLSGLPQLLRRGLVLASWGATVTLAGRWRGRSPAEICLTRAQAEVLYHQQVAAKAQAEAEKTATQLAQEYEQVYAGVQEWADRVAAESQQAIEEANAQTQTLIQQYEHRLAAATAPKTFTAADLVSFVGNQIQEILWQFDVECDADRAVETDSEHYLWFKPRKVVKLKEVQSAAEQIPAYVDGIFEPPSATMSGGMILLRYPFNQPAAKAQARVKEESLIAEGFDWLRSCVLDSVHDLVAGPTGSGKSTLIANLIDLVQSTMLREWGKDPSIWLVDPKCPDSEWRLFGVKVDPHYRGFDRYTDPSGQSYPNALDGYRAMSQSVRDRLRAAQDDWFHDRETDRDPEIWVCDEGEQMVAEYGAEASDPVQFVARVGRSTKVRLILIGQSPKCSAYKFRTISQLNNFTRFYLGEAILGAIDEIGRTTIEKNRMRKTLQKLEAIALTDPDKRYFCLVKQPSRPAYFAYLPPPGYFLQTNAPEVEPVPIAPPVQPCPQDLYQSDRVLLELVEAAKAEEAVLMVDRDRRLAVIQWDAANPEGRMLDRLADCWPELTVKTADGSKSARGYTQARQDLARLFPEKYSL